MSNKLAPIVIPVIVDAAGIDRGMRTAKQKLASGLGGPGGTDFGGASGFGSGSRGGGGSFLSRSLENAVGFRLANSKPRTREHNEVLSLWRDTMKERNKEEWSFLKTRAKDVLTTSLRNRREGPFLERIKAGGSLITRAAKQAKRQASTTGTNLLFDSVNKLSIGASALGVSTGVFTAGIGTAAVAGVSAVGSFREKMAQGTAGLQHLGAPGSGLNQSAMDLQRRQQSQPTETGGFFARAAAVSGSTTARWADFASTVVGSIFSAEWVGASIGNATSLLTGGYSESIGAAASRYGDFWSQRMEDWHTRSYGTGDDFREARKAARKANRLAERNAI
jgi:hypothetical protein